MVRSRPVRWLLLLALVLARLLLWSGELHAQDDDDDDDNEPAAATAAAAAEARIVVRDVKTSEGHITFHAENRDPVAPRNLEIKFKLKNMKASVPLPGRFVLPPGSNAPIMTLAIVDSDRAWSYRYDWTSGYGDPTKTPDPSAVYLFPFEHGSKFGVIQGYHGAFSHKDDYALDFDLPEGTTVCAARDGVVIDVKEDSDRGGVGDEFEALGNHVDVLHDDGTWADYHHLKRDGAFVSVGDRVSAGQAIGLSGNTGYSDGPHLHFEVDRPVFGNSDGKSLPTRFRSKDGMAIDPKEDKYYYAFHPGKADFDMVFASDMTESQFAARVHAVEDTENVYIRTEDLDEFVLFFAGNPKTLPASLELSFSKLKRLKTSKRCPMNVTIRPRAETYLLNVRRSATGATEYEYNYEWVTIADGASKGDESGGEASRDHRSKRDEPGEPKVRRTKWRGNESGGD